MKSKLIMADEGKFDGMLFTLAQQHPGGVFEVLDTLFNFLARKTDFYYGGPSKGHAQKVLLEKFNKYEPIALEKHQAEVKEREEADRIRKEKLRKKKNVRLTYYRFGNFFFLFIRTWKSDSSNTFLTFIV